MKRDFYIDFLKKIDANPKTWAEIVELFPDEHEAIWREHIEGQLLAQYKDGKYRLSFSSRFKLLEYEELQDARKNAKFATWTAIIAILVSIMIAGISVYFSTKQLDASNKPIEISASQIEEMKSLKFDQVLIEEKVDEILNNQVILIDKFEAQIEKQGLKK